MVTLAEFVAYMATKGFSEQEAMEVYRAQRGRVTSILCWFEVDEMLQFSGLRA